MSVGHVAPKSMYYVVFGALIVGTVLTVAAANVDMGAAQQRRHAGDRLHEGARSSSCSSCTSAGARG